MKYDSREVAVSQYFMSYTICSNSLAYARDAAMSLCFGISIFSSPFLANVIVEAVRLTSHPRYNKHQQVEG